MIVEKFEELGGSDVSYAEIAKKAWEVGRAGLATKVSILYFSLNSVSYPIQNQLLDHESKGSDQVPLLLEMKEDKLALVKAVDSGDSDLGLSFYSSNINRTCSDHGTSISCFAAPV